jgi:transcriptional regulator with XRE-family HTH domain
VASLRELRIRNVYSVRGLAKAAGVAFSTVHLVESGKATPHAATMRKIAAALGVEPMEIDEFRGAIEGKFAA